MLSSGIEVLDTSTLPPDAHSIQKLQDSLVSHYAHHGILLMTITLLIFFLSTRLFSAYLFPRLLYPRTYPLLTPRSQRRFVNHHVLITAKLLMITLALYPYMTIVLGHADFSTPIVAGSRATMGDITIVATCIFISVYLHELLYVSGDVQWVSVVHHVGAVVVAAVMVTRNVRWEVEANTTAYTVLIMTYGIFDILAGLWPRPVLLSRTIWPHRHRMNMWFCYAAVVLTGLGTVGETIVALYMYGVNFQGWSTPIQVVTPVCHVVFMLAQIYSSRIMWVLARKHRGVLRRRDEEERVVVEAEEAVETVERGKQPGGAADACASGGLVGQ